MNTVENRSDYREKENEWWAENLSGVLSGISLAGILFTLILLVLIFASAIWRDLALPNIEEAVVATLTFSFAGFVTSLLLGVISMTIVLLFNSSLGEPFSDRIAAMSIGSLTGYIPTSLFLFAVNHHPFSEYILPWLVLTLVAMTMGAIGAVRYCNFNRSLSDSRERKFKFSIKRMMIATAWIAVVLAFGNLTGSPRFVIAVAVWLILNGLLLCALRILRPASEQN